MNRLFKELSIIEFDVSDNKNSFIVNVRDIKNVQEQKKFDSFEEAMEYYKSLDGVKSVAPEVKEKDFGGVVKEAINSIEVRAYVKENPDKTSARHLNKKFDLNLSGKEYKEILKGL